MNEQEIEPLFAIERFPYRARALGRVGHCLLEVFRGPDALLAVATERFDNPGPSITNSAEGLWGSVKLLFERRGIAEGAPVRTFERYDRGPGDVTIDEVRPGPAGPEWRRLADPALLAAFERAAGRDFPVSSHGAAPRP